MLIPTPGPSGWYPISFAGLVWNHYIHPFVQNPHDRWFIKINDEKTSDVPCLHGVLEGFSAAKSGVAEINGTCVVQKGMSLATKNGESKDMWLGCTGVPNLLRHELTSLTSWPMHFRFSGFLVLWWPSKSLRNWLFGSSWLSMFTCFTNMFLQTGYSNSSIFTFQEVPCWNEIRSYSSIMTFQQDHDVTQ